MSRIYLQTYGPFELRGKDFGVVESKNDNKRRILFSPDDKHSISLNFLRDGLLLFSNESKTAFQFSVARNSRLMAMVKFEYAEKGKLYVNNNFSISKIGVTNKEIHTNPNLSVSNIFHIDVSGDGIGRIDLKVDESGFAACIFSDIQLLFVRMNGNHVVQRLDEFVQRECDRTDVPIGKMREYARANPNFAREVAQNYISDWFKANERSRFYSKNRFIYASTALFE